MYYITNYATKDENSTYQMVTAAAVIKDSQERAKAASEASDEDRNTGPWGSMSWDVVWKCCAPGENKRAAWVIHAGARF